VTKQVQLRRGTTAEHSTFTGAVGEVTVDTDKDVVVVHDGATAGGFPLLGTSKISTTASGVSVSGSTNETDYELTGTAIDPANGGIQYKTLSGDVTFTESLADGDSVILRLINGASHTVSWPTTTWAGASGNSEPTLTADDVLVFWQSNNVFFGAHVGSAA